MIQSGKESKPLKRWNLSFKLSIYIDETNVSTSRKMFGFVSTMERFLLFFDNTESERQYKG